MIICPKQGPKIEGAVLHRVGILGLFLSYTVRPSNPQLIKCPSPWDKSIKKFEGAVKSKTKT